jgi:hypothetical protein
MEIVLIIIFIIFVLGLVGSAASPKKPRYRQGFYTPEHPHKYRGNLNKIEFRSGWELTAFNWCDLNYHVAWWKSEEVKIKYRMGGYYYKRTYWPDLIICYKSGEIKMVEIKPSDQKIDPDKQNKCKWYAARQYCNKRGWKFEVWAEDTIEKLNDSVENWKNLRQQKSYNAQV